MRSLAILGSFLPPRFSLTRKDKVLGVVLLLASFLITLMVLAVTPSPA